MGRLRNPSAAYNYISIVKDRRLSGGDGALRLVERDQNFVVSRLFDQGRSALMAMADFHSDSHGLAQLVHRDQIDPMCAQSAGVEFLLLTNHHLAGVSLDLDHVERRASG